MKFKGNNISFFKNQFFFRNIYFFIFAQMKFKLAILFISLPLLIFGNSISTFSENFFNNHSTMACCSDETESTHDCCCDHSENSSSDCDSQCAANGCFFSSPTFIANATSFTETVSEIIFNDSAVALEPASLIASFTGSIWIPPKIVG